MEIVPASLSCLHLSDGQITLGGIATCMQNNHNMYAVLVVIRLFLLRARDLDPGPADAEGNQVRCRFTVSDTSGTCFGVLLRVGRLTKIHPGPAIEP
jgi:hypothetical protein